MPRIISPTWGAQLASTGVSAPVLFVVLKFANETLYLFGGIGSLTPPGPAYSPLATFPYGQTFTGLGWLAKISTIPQTTKIQAQNITLTLSGIPQELVLDAINQVRITGTAAVFLGFFNLATGALIADPVQLFLGALDVPTLVDSGETCTLTITAENPLLSLNFSPQRQFDDADQQIKHPGDLGFCFVDALENSSIFWPAPDKWSSPYPISMTLSPNGSDIAVGGTTTISATIHYNTGASKTEPGGSGSGPSFVPLYSSTDPSIATVDLNGIVTGRKPGTCSILVRVPNFTSGGAPFAELRAACGIIVRTV